jgi:hypothetical protein
MFGGAPDAKTTTAGDPVLGDLWKWNDADGWACIETIDGPCARGSTCLVALPAPYDDWILLWGGYTGKQVLNDTWLFHTVSGKWIELGILSGSPSARGGYGIAFVGNGRLMLVGGFDLESGSQGDIYLMHIG